MNRFRQIHAMATFLAFLTLVSGTVAPDKLRTYSEDQMQHFCMKPDKPRSLT